MMNPLRTNLKGRRRALGLALALALVAVPGSVVLVGCGGGSGSSAASSRTTGKATIKITWPTTTAKLIPAASNSITVAFLSGTSTVSTQTVSRPTSGNTSTLTFTSLPAGSLTLTATAYPTTTGTGTAQATASQTVTITGGQTATLAISMASTIASLTVSPTTVSVAAGSTTTVTATPKDSSGATVLVGTSTLTFASSNTSVATVNATTGVVTGIAAGTASITATESESGKTATSTVTVTSTSGGTTIVDLTNAYLATLTSAQLSATEVAASQTAAAKWINLPATPNSDGTQSQRNGVAYSTLTTAQQTAWNNLVAAMLADGTAANQFSLIRGSDNVLRNTYGNNGYSGDYQYIGVVGTPSTSAGWMLQLGGHHNAHNYYYNGTTLQTTTPYFLGTEPTSYTSGSTTVYPMGTQSSAATAFLKSLTTTQLSGMKLSSSFSDVYLGPGKDARSNFPTGTSGRGALVSSLSLTDTQNSNLKAEIDAWTQGRTSATLGGTYSSVYETDTNLNNTYVAYSGNSSAPTTVFTAQGDYLRIDGPNVWIEFVCQNGIVIQNQIHYHSIWRDRVTDYNAAYGF